MLMILVSVLIIVFLVKLPATTRQIRSGGSVPFVVILFDRMVGGACMLKEEEPLAIQHYRKLYGKFPLYSHAGGANTKRYNVLRFRIWQGLPVAQEGMFFVNRYQEEERLLELKNVYDKRTLTD